MTDLLHFTFDGHEFLAVRFIRARSGGRTPNEVWTRVIFEDGALNYVGIPAQNIVERCRETDRYRKTREKFSLPYPTPLRN